MCLHIIHLITHNSFLMYYYYTKKNKNSYLVISLHIIIKRSAQFKTVFSFSLFLFLRRFPWWKKKKNNVLRFFFFLLLLVVYYSCCASCIASSRSSSSSSSSRQSEQHHHQSDEKERRRSKKRRCERRRGGERRSRRVRPVSRPVRLVRVHGHEPGGGAMPATGGERHSRWERCDAERLPVRDTGEVFGRRESVYRGGKIRTKRVRDEEDIRGTRRI